MARLTKEGIDGAGESEMSLPGGTEYHVPVLYAEVLDALQPVEGKLIVDCTLGGGGHSEALLEAGATVIGVDQDPEAIHEAGERLAAYGDRFRVLCCSFADAPELLTKQGITGVDGVLMDLGVSSHQLDTPARGFSFQAEGPLDMRMNPEGLVRASDLVNTASAEQLERIFKEYGEEPNARRIAARVVRERAVSPLRTTLDLAGVVESVVPRRGRAHPATRVFQALRIAVNRELEVLSDALESFTDLLNGGGRMAVISFHSLEDRVVKQYFARRSAEWMDRPEWNEARRNPACIFKKVTGKPVVAGEEELERNPRSRSAKLRVVEKLVNHWILSNYEY